MSLSVDSSNTGGFNGIADRGSDTLSASTSPSGERTGPMTIRARAPGLQVTLSDGLPGTGSSGGGFPYRRLHRDSIGGSFREFRRDHRSYSTDWISSPLLEGFASFHSALNGVQEGAETPAATPSTGSNHDVLGCSLPYLGTCWSADHSGQSSVDSTRSTQESSTMNSTIGSPASESLVLDEWDLVKPRTFSIDVSSPMPMENLMPFMFPMDPADASPASHVTSETTCPVTSSTQSTDFFAGQAHLHQHQGMGSTLDHTSASMAPYAPSSMFAHQPDHLPRVPYSHWQQHHQQTMISDPNRAVFTASSPLNSSVAHVGTPMASQSHQFPLQQHSQQFASQSLAVRSPPAATSMPTIPLADTQLLTKLNSCYWKNGRKNLQCFPICPEHNDFYSMKMSNRKHTSVGVCRGPVYTHVFLPAASSTPGGAKFPVSSSMGQHMKYEFGVGASGSGGSAYEVFVLGKFERVPQRNENDDLEDLLSPPEQFQSAAAFEAFRYSCFQAVEMEERRVTTATRPSDHHTSALPDHIVRSTWFFLPDVWKVQPMLKKKRKATRSAPAQAFPFCFRVFVYIREPASVTQSSGGEMDSGTNSGGAYRCLATTASSFFELYSTRTVDRVKRKYWGQEDGETDENVSTTPSSSRVAKRASR